MAFALSISTARAETVTDEPDAFLDYIEANGSQYIDTGVNAETGLKSRIDMEWGAVVKELSAGGFDLLRHYLPCIKGGRAGLYDKVSETYFRDSGKYMLAGGGEERPLVQGMMIIVR